MNFLRKLIVTGLGTGYLPAGGTWGSLVTVGIYLGVAFGLAGMCIDRSMTPTEPEFVWPILQLTMIATAVLASVACVKLGDFTERTWKKKDPGQCTIDEVAGQAVALLAVPMAAEYPYGYGWLITAGVCFALFRVFDILKPPPVRQFEKLPKGWGVLADDLMAGVYANLAAQIVLRVVL